MLGEFALGDIDLTAPANAAPAADGIEIDAELARGFEHAHAVGDFAALARGREDDPVRCAQLSGLAPFVLGEHGEAMRIVFRLEARGGGARFRLEIVAARHRLAAPPFGEIGVGARGAARASRRRRSRG